MVDPTISERIKKVIVEQLGVPEEQVTENASFVNDLDADSLDALNLLMAINEEFGTHIPAEELDNIHTVGDMEKTVNQALRT